MKEKLAAASVSQAVNEDFSQVLNFPEGFFIEVVLKDASQLEATRRAISEFVEQCKKKRIQVDFNLRAIWRVESLGAAYGPAGVPKASVLFRVGLQFWQ